MTMKKKNAFYAKNLYLYGTIVVYGQNATGQNATREVNGQTKCHWQAQLLAHTLSQTHLLRLGSYFFFSWIFLPWKFTYC